MSWESTWDSPFAGYLAAFLSLSGDTRTTRTFIAIIQGIIAAGSTLCQQIAAHSPHLAPGRRRTQRVIRFVTAQSTTRSHFDADHLTARLRTRAVEHLSAAASDELWLLIDGSDLRKPHARALPYLQKVHALDGRLVNGYATLTVLGVTPQRRGIL